MKKKVTIIGNNASNGNVSDGGRIKIRLYQKLLKECGIECEIIDLDNWKKRFFQIVKQIKNAIKNEDTLLIMAGPNGCRFIIPLINRLNKKSRVVFCPLGVGTLDTLISNLTENEVIEFLNCNDYFGITDKKMAKHLKKLNLIIPQNEQLVKVYKNFYKIDNVKLLYNFRDCDLVERSYDFSDDFKIIFASRVCENKGIFDLLKTITKIRQSGKKISLDIYGELQLSEEQTMVFTSYLSNYIKYKGTIKFEDMISTMKKYDLFCLPTKYHGEGTSGALIESFISGTPALISSYSQARLLIEHNKNGYIFEIGNLVDLEEKLISIFENRTKLKNVALEAQKLSHKYLFKSNKEIFLTSILGEQK